MPERHDIRPLVVHVPYFINLASADASRRFTQLISSGRPFQSRGPGAGTWSLEATEPGNLRIARCLVQVLDSIFQVLDRYHDR